jgi:hypothetical protein
MRDGRQIQLHLLVLKGGAVRAEGVILRQHLTEGAAAIRGDFDAHLLRAFLATFLHFVDQTADALGWLKLQLHALGGVFPGA